MRVNTGVGEWQGRYEVVMGNADKNGVVNTYSEPLRGTRFEDKVFWVTPFFPGLFHLEVVVTSRQSLDPTALDSKTFSRKITFAVAAGSEDGSYSRLIDFCITQLQARG